jgi:Ca2+-binding EF-hand superfamily protein
MMKRLHTLRLPLAAAALTIAGGFAAVSLADDMGKHEGRHGHHGDWSRMMLTEMDADKDGTVTRAEIDAHEAARAAEIDADKNGTITAEELIAHHEKMRQQRMAERLKAMDQNGDGTVSLDEYEAAQTWRMARLDRNGDGKIEPDEMQFRHGGERHHP